MRNALAHAWGALLDLLKLCLKAKLKKVIINIATVHCSPYTSLCKKNMKVVCKINKQLKIHIVEYSIQTSKHTVTIDACLTLIPISYAIHKPNPHLGDTKVTSAAVVPE